MIIMSTVNEIDYTTSVNFYCDCWHAFTYFRLKILVIKKNKNMIVQQLRNQLMRIDNDFELIVRNHYVFDLVDYINSKRVDWIVHLYWR